MKKHPVTLALACIVLGFTMFVIFGKQNGPVVRIAVVEGKVTAKLSDSAVFVSASIDQQLSSGDAIKTNDASKAALEFISDKSQVLLGKNTYLEIHNFSEKELRQISGIAIYQINKQGRKLKIETPQGIASILGTILRIDATASETIVSVKEGKVAFSRKSGQQVIINGGQQYATSYSENTALPIATDEIEALFRAPDSHADSQIKPELDKDSFQPGKIFIDPALGTDEIMIGSESNDSATRFVSPESDEPIFLKQYEQKSISVANFGSIVLAGPVSIEQKDNNAKLIAGHALFDISSSDPAKFFLIKTEDTTIKTGDAIFGIEKNATSTRVILLSGNLSVNCNGNDYNLAYSYSAEVSAAGFSKKLTTQDEHAYWSLFPENMTKQSTEVLEDLTTPPESATSSVLSPQELLEKMNIEQPKEE
ncbi:MAG: FecR family protein [Candidatus Riflebacteria bacterium]|nr:FecR family protein [Candidatus Riflebacteria bacterium]